MSFVSQLYHLFFIGHELPSDVNEDNIEDNIGRIFRCGCGANLQITYGILSDYMVLCIGGGEQK